MLCPILQMHIHPDCIDSLQQGSVDGCEASPVARSDADAFLNRKVSFTFLDRTSFIYLVHMGGSSIILLFNSCPNFDVVGRRFFVLVERCGGSLARLGLGRWWHRLSTAPVVVIGTLHRANVLLCIGCVFLRNTFVLYRSGSLTRCKSYIT